MAEVAEVSKALSLEGYGGPGKEEFGSHAACVKLNDLGTELWVDTGDLDAASEVWRKEFAACTTNNTLANQVIQTGRMDEDIKHIVGELKTSLKDLDEKQLLYEMGFVVNCRIALGLVSALGCMVSVELHPDFAHDVDLTVEYAKRYFDVCPENFYIKVPLTPAGYVATRRLSDAGVPINFTIGFSARQNYLAALLSRPAFCNVFLGRNNQVVKENSLGSGDYVGETATLSAQRSVRSVRESHPEIRTRLIAASMRGGQQVYDLAGVDVMTIPPKAVKQFYESEPLPSDLKSQLGTRFELGLSDDAESVNILWRVSDEFKEYVAKLAKLEVSELTPELLVEQAKEAGLNFLHRFGGEEIAKIKERGKIPGLSDWQGDIALDDLMTESALVSFATDQNALDERIRSFL